MTRLDIQSLTESILFELTKAFALPPTSRASALIRRIFGKAARAAAELGIELDHIVAKGGLSAGAHWLLPRFVKSHAARGTENIPASGPLLIASNHPGSVDSIVISAYVSRPDYKIIIGDIPFFQRLPHISERAIFAPEKDPMGRMRTVRESIRHLKRGGALLIFPRGSIEADPDFMPHPDGEFHLWSRSLEIFTQHVPGLQILITMTGGVISQFAMRHPITWFRKARPDRQRLAFLYQLARQILSGRDIFDLAPRVTFGEMVSEINSLNPLAEIEAAARRTLTQHMAWARV
ncbi:MAG TPA: 1-acyl-sn-glycerol-3-phosphate acyltransferase [Anaerolineales bacterium]|nr:1-acyl-sn-glycerol-3-phosphate acyltransferase [Anaerolineales bacterium]